ncbi:MULTISPECIES: hypothetical protein [Pseudomonas]|uniref:hypothetical protein n=1 Tax=Pseudomonas TaxID=286 RepID=UPI001AE3AA3A|nr:MULTISPECIES: hypothetical protein [unclassified Pseudomonas]MBP1128365.1 hypothetical protein [Pseudomonas sp. PvP025]MDQ0397302.1 hypothetical protein [Pseudomonas sp. PvP006]
MYLTLPGAWLWGCCAAQRRTSLLTTGNWLLEISGFKSKSYFVFDKRGLAPTVDRAAI